VSAGCTRAAHLDHLGTPQEMTNQAGKVVWSVSYKAYGNLAVAHVNEIDNPIRFQGQYHDIETGLHYNRHRYYDPNCGQFVTQDPIGLAGGLNNYQYVPNPTGWIDPLGLSSSEVESVCPKPASLKYKVVQPGTKEWDQAVSTIANQGKGKSNFRVANHENAKRLMNESMEARGTGNLNRYKNYTHDAKVGKRAIHRNYDSGYENHAQRNNQELDVGNDLPHLKWFDGKSSGHIFYEN